MADLGTKAAPDGGNVLTLAESGLRDTTKRNHLKAAKWETFTHTFSSNPGAGSIDLGSVAHGLSFVPGYDAMYDIQLVGEYSQVPFVFFNSSGLAMTGYRITAKTNATNIVFRLTRVDFFGGAPLDFNGTTIRFKYRIHGDPGA